MNNQKYLLVADDANYNQYEYYGDTQQAALAAFDADNYNNRTGWRLRLYTNDGLATLVRTVKSTYR